MRSLIAVALLLTSCTSTVTPTSTIPPSTTTTFSVPSVTVIPLSAPPPRGVDPASSCMRRAVFGNPAESDYLLPYPAGVTYELHQSYCFAEGSHNDELSYDFLMPIGSDIVASRSGTVVDLYDGGPDNGTGQANYLIIQHEDGSAAIYAHLEQHGIVVGLGDQVTAGDRVATSGFSGVAGLPHLHFTVYDDWPNIGGNDIAVNFRNTDGPLDFLGGLLMGVRYEALPPDHEPVSVQPQQPGDYQGAELQRADLSGATLWRFDFSEADLSGANLSGANLEFAVLEGAKLTGADLSRSDLTQANLDRANLKGADLSGANLSLTSLQGATLAGADLSGAYLTAVNLSGADLSGALLAEAAFIGVVWDAATRWPDGYDPPPMP